MDAKREVERLLKDNHCELIRTTGRHPVFRLPNGNNWVTQCTEGDPRAWRNNLADLRAVLGISKRGKMAVQGERRAKKKPIKRVSLSQTFQPAPNILGFQDKMRLAIFGTRVPRGFDRSVTLPRSTSEDGGMQAEGPEPTGRLLTQSPADPPNRTRHSRKQKDPRERPGAVRVWTPAEIAAANVAMRMGQLAQYMQEDRQATTNQPINQEEEEMLTVESIDTSIAELEQGMEAALADQTAEQSIITRLNADIEQAQGRLMAAGERHKSLTSMKDTFLIVRDDVQRVRPMLGHLAEKPAAIKTTEKMVHTRTGRLIRLKDAIAQVLEEAEAPMRVAEIHEAAAKLGCTHTRNSFYTFLAADHKKNGDAIAKRIADNQYVRSTKHQVGAA